MVDYQWRSVEWLIYRHLYDDIHKFFGWANMIYKIWCKTSLVAQTVKHPSTMRETQVQPLGQEDPLEKEMAIHSSAIAWKIPWTEEPGRLQSMGLQRVGHDWTTSHAYVNIWYVKYLKECLAYWNHSTGCILLLVVELSEKATTPHSSTLAWKIPWTEEPGGL